jgi:hypothetical protein
MAEGVRGRILTEKEKADDERFAYMADLAPQAFVEWLATVRPMEPDEMTFLRAAIETMHKFHGRVYCRQLSKLAGGKRRWYGDETRQSLRRRTSDVIVELDNWAKVSTEKRGVCRQYGIRPDLIASFKQRVSQEVA